ncbi:hypothetical protein K9N68_32735 [Kovacikia minuta CCNUW1]|nr:hypothetical protein [Kovacikia minuta]UBF26222.1 hypothetical protein K9N68_32735 [Kovacikia minuta CCNUW1]
MRYAIANSTLRNHGAIPKYVGTKAAGLIVAAVSKNNDPQFKSPAY